jgi:protein TonB
MNPFTEAVWGGHGAAIVQSHTRTRAEAQETFLRGMLDMPSQRGERNPLDWVVSLIVHIVVVGVVVLAPLLFTQVVDLRGFETTFLVAPRPPAAAPPPAAQVQKVARPAARIIQPTRLTAPAVIPVKVRIIRDEAPPEIAGAGVVGGVPGGQAGGVLGGIIGGTAEATPVAPPPPAARKILRVGGDVKEPQPISTPQPIYPAVAVAARVEGVVVIDAVIDEQGNVVRAQIVDGPPLLIRAALAAVLQWKYQPTYLDGQAVAINTHVQVHFHLR